MKKCRICKKRLKIVTNTHLKTHSLQVSQYLKMFPEENVCFVLKPNLLPNTDYRYIKWRKSLKGRISWNKGKTKDTDKRLMKMAKTMKTKKIDNFKNWRNKMKKEGKVKSTYPSLIKNEDTAELIGLILGDGNLHKQERVERLLITFNRKYPRIIERGIFLIKKTFNKKPSIRYITESNCAIGWIYEKFLSKRLGIPCGAKRRFNLKIPRWIWDSRELIIACLTGLYNAEGSLSIHLRTCTYNLQFSNMNTSLLEDVYKAIKMLKYNPHLRRTKVTLRKRTEVYDFAKLIRFEYYRSLK